MTAILPRQLPAAAITDLLDVRLLEVHCLQQALSALSIGVVLTDEHAGIRYANDAAETMLVAGTPIRSRNGVLATHSSSATLALRSAIRQAVSTEAGPGPAGIGIPGSDGHGGAVVRVLALGRRQDMLPGQAPSVAVFVAGNDYATRIPADVMASAFSLTPAETKLLVRIAEGHTLAEIARSSRVARSTIKTHLVHLFDKTGTRRQVELVKLAKQFALPLRSVGIAGQASA